MLQEQERRTSPMTNLIDLGGGMTPRPIDRPDILLETTPAPSIKSSGKFFRLVKKLKDTGKLDREDFNSGKELGMFMDFWEDMEKRKREKTGISDVREISKSVARQMFEKTFFMKPLK